MNQPHNHLELRNDLCKGSIFLLENVSLKCHYLQVDCTSLAEITSVGKLIFLRCQRNRIQTCWCFNHRWLCSVRSSTAHIKRGRARCCGGRGTFEKHGWKRGQWSNHVIPRLHRSTSAALVMTNLCTQ